MGAGRMCTSERPPSVQARPPKHPHVTLSLHLTLLPPLYVSVSGMKAAEALRESYTGLTLNAEISDCLISTLIQSSPSSRQVNEKRATHQGPTRPRRDVSSFDTAPQPHSLTSHKPPSCLAIPPMYESYTSSLT